MKVLCIEGTPSHPLVRPLPEGCVLIASQCPVYENNYDIEGHEYMTDGKPVSHHKRRFIPVSDIDETELVNTKEEVYAG